MKTITVYEASDGSVHKSEADAVAHERKLAKDAAVASYAKSLPEDGVAKRARSAAINSADRVLTWAADTGLLDLGRCAELGVAQARLFGGPLDDEPAPPPETEPETAPSTRTRKK